MTHRFESLTPDQARILYAALLNHDGRSIRPEASDINEWLELTHALKKLRAILIAIKREVLP